MTKKLSILLIIALIISMTFTLTALAAENPTSVTTESPSEVSTGIHYKSSFDSAMRYEMLFLLLIVVLCYFETVLTNKENKNLGLILPAISLIAMTVLTFVYTFKAAKFSIIGFIITFVFLNIPTLILFLIYHFGRKKYEKETRK